MVALLTAVNWVPFLVIGLPAGAWVDRWPRRGVLLTADLVSAVALASVPIAAWTGVLTIGMLLVAALLAGVAKVFFDLAYNALPTAPDEWWIGPSRVLSLGGMSYQQQPPQFQPYPQPPYQPPQGMLHLTIQGSALTSNMIPPTVHLNGYPVPVKYGRNDIPVFAGPLHIDIHSQWILVYGRATLDCTVLPNQAVPVFYASPYSQFTSAGSIGHTKVSRNGIGSLFALIGTIVAALLLVILLTAVS